MSAKKLKHTIAVPMETKRALARRKLVPEESYNGVIRRLLEATKSQ